MTSVHGNLVTGPSAGTEPVASVSVALFSDSAHFFLVLVSDAVALGTFRTRLETRTKESSMCASHWDLAKPKGIMKVKKIFLNF